MIKSPMKILGWREYCSLPSLGCKKIKVKVDSGAKTSSLHAYNLKYYKRNNKQYVKFDIHTFENKTPVSIETKARVLEFRKVKSSNGHVEERPVVETEIILLGETWKIELTLTNRDEMGFKMLLGREAIKKRFLINPAKSFLCNKKVKNETSNSLKRKK